MKPFWQSKTLWVNLAMAIIAFFPVVTNYLDAEKVAMVFAGANAVLRIVTKDKISLT